MNSRCRDASRYQALGWGLRTNITVVTLVQVLKNWHGLRKGYDFQFLSSSSFSSEIYEGWKQTPGQ